MKEFSIVLMFFCFSITLAQSELKPPDFLDPKIDSVAFINCTQETLDTIIWYVKKNPKFIIDNNITCTAKVVSTIEKDFSTLIRSDDNITIKLILRNKISKKYYYEIKKYYTEQARLIVGNLYGLFIPTRKNGIYSASSFYLNIDFSKGENPQIDSLKSDVFQKNDLSFQTIQKNNKLREKGIRMLKDKKPQLAFVYFRMAYITNKDIESLVLLGNLWDIMGEPETACYHWKKAVELGNKNAENLIIKCNK